MFILVQRKNSLVKYVVSDDKENLVNYIMSNFSKVKKYSDRYYKDSTGIEFNIYLGEVI